LLVAAMGPQMLAAMGPVLFAGRFLFLLFVLSFLPPLVD
jgi:hypothetical protein